MTDQSELQRLFRGAKDRPPQERQEFLAAATNDEQLQQEVLELLAAHDESDVNVEVIVGEAAAELEQSQMRQRAIGPYRIVELISEGGMGRVYLAERDDEQFEQQVAIKVLGTSLPSPLLLERFRAERQCWRI